MTFGIFADTHICIIFFLIIRYFASRLKRKEYNWHILDNWAFLPVSLGGSSLPTGRQACLMAGSRLRSQKAKNRWVLASLQIPIFGIIFFLIIRYFASGLKRKEYNWHKLDNWVFRSPLPPGRQACLPAGGRLLSQKA